MSRRYPSVNPSGTAAYFAPTQVYVVPRPDESVPQLQSRLRPIAAGSRLGTWISAATLIGVLAIGVVLFVLLWPENHLYAIIAGIGCVGLLGPMLAAMISKINDWSINRKLRKTSLMVLPPDEGLELTDDDVDLMVQGQWQGRDGHLIG